MVVLLGLGHMSSHTHVCGPCSTMQRIRGTCARTCVLQKQGIRGHGSGCLGRFLIARTNFVIIMHV